MPIPMYDSYSIWAEDGKRALLHIPHRAALQFSQPRIYRVTHSQTEGKRWSKKRVPFHLSLSTWKGASMTDWEGQWLVNLILNSVRRFLGAWISVPATSSGLHGCRTKELVQKQWFGTGAQTKIRRPCDIYPLTLQHIKVACVCSLSLSLESNNKPASLPQVMANLMISTS